MTLLYKPFALILALLAGRVAVSIFESIWDWVDGDEFPDPEMREASLRKVLFAAALQGVVTKGTHAAIMRGGAHGWERMFGVWPGEDAPEPAEAA